jgi:hypothetical protein
MKPALRAAKVARVLAIAELVICVPIVEVFWALGWGWGSTWGDWVLVGGFYASVALACASLLLALIARYRYVPVLGTAVLAGFSLALWAYAILAASMARSW